MYGWTAGTTAKSGTLYIQDQVAAGGTAVAKSGVQIYFPASGASTYGAVPTIGNVVSITGLSWSPYAGANMYPVAANQYSASATTKVSVLGSAALPPPVMVPASMVSPTSSLTATGFEGMRVIVTGSSFKVQGSENSNTCPASLQYGG